jgi:DNA-binding beta-propeller fold protein YncE
VIQSAKPTLRHVIPPDGDRAVIGVTSVGDRLFVLRSPSLAAIDVYDTVKFSPQAPVRVDGLDNNHKNALTSCAHNNCLYVGDCSRNVVLKIDVSADVTTSKWRVGLMPTGLSVNVARHLLVTCCDADKIQEYTPEGLLVREICLQAKNISLKPRHVVQLSCGLLAVCHYDPVHDVSEIDLDGRIVVSYASRLKSTTKNKFVYPRHLAVSESDCIIVADSWNHRIVVLNHSLNCVRESSVTVDGGFKEPRIIHLDASYDRLYIGEYKGNRVLVFDNVLNVNGSLK